MKHSMLFLLAAGMLASCAAPTTSSNSTGQTPTPEETSTSVEGEKPEPGKTSEDTKVPEPGKTSEDTKVPEPEQTSSPTEPVTPTPAGTTWTFQDFPVKENNTYPVDKVVEKDGYSFKMSYVMQGNTQLQDGTKADVFQMKKGVAFIESTMKITGKVTFTYVNRGAYTGILTGYAGASLDALTALPEVTPVELDANKSAISFEVNDSFVSFKNDSRYAFYGLELKIEA